MGTALILLSITRCVALKIIYTIKHQLLAVHLKGQVVVRTIPLSSAEVDLLALMADWSLPLSKLRTNNFPNWLKLTIRGTRVDSAMIIILPRFHRKRDKETWLGKFPIN